MQLLRGDLADELDGDLRDDIVIWGASQGGHAAFFVEAAGPDYGPEFDVGDECDFDLDFEIEVDAVEDIYAQSFIDAVLAGDWDAIEPWSCFLRENSVSTSSITRKRTTPMLTVYGELDTLVVPALQEANFAALCSNGWQLQQLQCQGAPHAETTLWSLNEQVAWLRDRLDGEPLESPCTWNAPVCCSASPEDVCP